MLSLLDETDQAAYQAYARGQSTPETRAAKRRYMRLRRERARARRIAFELANPGVRYVVEGITHGSGGYTNEACRCRICNIARKRTRGR